MGNRSAKSGLRNAIIHLNISADQVSVRDDKFWNQIFSEDTSTAAEVIKSISTQEIRMLRDGSPKNFATLTYKIVERLCLATGTLCNTQSQQTAVLNATRILIRIVPHIFEDEAWREFFTENFIDTASGLRTEPKLVFPQKGKNDRDYNLYVPSNKRPISPQANSGIKGGLENSRTQACPHRESPIAGQVDVDLLGEHTLFRTESRTDVDQLAVCYSPTDILDKNGVSLDKRSAEDKSNLMKTLTMSICDLLFCPEFTVIPHGDSYLSNTVDAPPEDLKSLATCDYVWEPGVGFDSTINSTTSYDKNRCELLRALLACLSATLYETPESSNENKWIRLFASNANRHALPIFTSLLNTVFIFRPSKQFLTLNNILYDTNREELVELCLQLLIATLDYKTEEPNPVGAAAVAATSAAQENLFIEYMSRIHRNEDFDFLIKGFTRLLGNRLETGSLLNSTKQINFDQELLILLWKICNLNRKFIQYLLKSNEILQIVVPVLYHVNENFQDPSKTALIHIGVFNLLILSGERNFGVRLNKNYTANYLTNLPEFTGSHADLLIIVSHKLIMYGYNLNQLYDYLLTIIVNISPYLKRLTTLASKCLIQLFETFSSPFVILTEPNYHQLVVFLLEIFNNIIQYQFDGNTNLVYVILGKKDSFVNLANLSTSQKAIDKILTKLVKRKQQIKRDDLSSDGSKSCDTASERNSLFLGNSRATISSIESQSTNSQVQRQEVSLVATPDLCNVTYPTHLFDFDNSNHAQSIDEKVTSTRGGATRRLGDFMDIIEQQVFVEGDQQKTGEIRNSSELLAHFVGKEGEENSSYESFTMENETTIVSGPLSGTQETLAKPIKWKPTSDWLREWKQTLPIQTILRMIEVLVPQLDQLPAKDELEVINFLQNGTLVGLLPVPHPILIRKYHTSDGSAVWFRACTWAIIYVRNSIWTGTNIQLIRIV